MVAVPTGPRRRLARRLPAGGRGAARGAARAARRAAERVRRDRRRRGEGGDRTLVIDAGGRGRASSPSSSALHDEGARFTAVSEERGVVDFGGDGVLVVIDPIDGSLNAKRGLPHHALSIAVADGPTMADVVFGYVYDLGPGEEWWARRGEGAFLDGVRARPAARAPRRRRPPRAGRDRVRRPALARRRRRDELERSVAPRPRDGLDRGLAVPGRRHARRRDGVAVALPRGRRRRRAADRPRERRPRRVHRRCDDPLGAPLDLEPHSPVVAARTPEALAAAGARCRRS